MSLNATPKGDRVHIALFGKRNAGKSSVINAITGQDLAIVSEIKGTTTDPVSKAMELLPIGPVMVIDTPGLDDEGILGEQRIEKAMQVLNKTDIALVVIDGSACIEETDEENLKEEEKILQLIQAKNIPYIIVYNKIDLLEGKEEQLPKLSNRILVSAKSKKGIQELKEFITKQLPEEREAFPIVRDMLQEGDFVILVVPIDKAAPKGRLILPQQQTIRDILEAGATSIVVRDSELEETLQKLGKKPKLVITDSQAFAKVSKLVPRDIWLTSFSILFARHKGELAGLMTGVQAIEQLKEGDKILMAEGCTHHRQCDDIGTVKIPKWIQEYTGKTFQFETSSGTGYPKKLQEYALIIHCGGCTLNEKEMKYRIQTAGEQQVPIINYGILISYMNGILKRTLEPFQSCFERGDLL